MKKYFILAIALLIVTSSFAQKDQRRYQEKNPELRKEMQEFKKNTIIPMMEKAQADFDAQLSNEDLKFIKEKRTVAAQNRKEAMARKKEMRKQREEARKKMENDPEARKKFHEERSARHEGRHHKRHEMRKDLQSFMERNQDLIASALEDLKAEKEALKPEVEAIFKKHNVDPSRERDFKRGKMHRHHRGKGFHGKKEGHHRRDSMSQERRAEKMERHQNRKAIKFLLWNKNIEQAQSRDAGRSATPRLNQNFPNPAKDQTTIEFSLPQQMETVNVTIVDLNGKLVKTLDLNNLDKGDHQINIDLDGIRSGTYFYTVKAGDFVQTKKMVVSK